MGEAMPRRWAVAFGLSLAALAVCGCAGFLPRTEPATFYVLSASPEVGAGPPLSVALGVGPVLIPDYVDRPQIVTRVAPNQLDLSESRRWAGPLQKRVTELMLLNLSRQLGTDRATAFPFAMGLPRELDAVINLTRFEVSSEGEVRVEAFWWIRDPRTTATLEAREFTSVRTVPAGDYAGAAAAMSAALADLSVEMAAAIRKVYPGPS